MGSKTNGGGFCCDGWYSFVSCDYESCRLVARCLLAARMFLSCHNDENTVVQVPVCPLCVLCLNRDVLEESKKIRVLWLAAAKPSKVAGLQISFC